MEAVLDIYEQPYDPNQPVLCMDEQPVQLIKETRRPIPATRHHAKRVECEYERAGTARTSKTKLVWALEAGRLLKGRYRCCPVVTLVCDNLNTHTIGAFYEAFPPARARAMVSRLNFCHTPKHGSWLNIAENELNSLTRRCVSGRRFGALAKLQSELAAWSTDVNTTQRGVDWQITVNDALGKPKSLYPKIKL
jgi:hypothetical protein